MTEQDSIERERIYVNGRGRRLIDIGDSEEWENERGVKNKKLLSRLHVNYLGDE